MMIISIIVLIISKFGQVKIQREKDPDHAPAPLVGFAYDAPMNIEFSQPHIHKKTQVLYCRSGCFQTQVDPYEFLVPPTTAIIIPGKTKHSGRTNEVVQFRSLYINQEHYTELPNEPMAIHVSPLLRALISKACCFSWDYQSQSPESRLCDVIVDELLSAKRESFYLPITHHESLSTIKDFLLDNLHQKMNAPELAKQFGMSSKTLSRLCQNELGMSFEAWRQQIKLMKAIELLSGNATTTDTAQALGYHADSAFIQQFKKLTGLTPTEFMRQRQAPI